MQFYNFKGSLAAFTVFALSIPSVLAAPIKAPVDAANAVPTAPINVPFPLPPLTPESDMVLPESIRIYQHTHGPSSEFEGWTGLGLLAKCPTGVNCRGRGKPYEPSPHMMIPDKKGKVDDFKAVALGEDIEFEGWVITHDIKDGEGPVPAPMDEDQTPATLSKRQSPKEEVDEGKKVEKLKTLTHADLTPSDWSADFPVEPIPEKPAPLPLSPEQIALLERYESYHRRGATRPAPSWAPKQEADGILDLAWGGAKIVSMKALEALATHPNYYSPTGDEVEEEDLASPFGTGEGNSNAHHPVLPIGLEGLLRLSGNALCLASIFMVPGGAPQWDCFI